MNEVEGSYKFDYSYFLYIAGIGVLFSCAVLLVSIGYGVPSYGYFSGGGVLFLTTVILFFKFRPTHPVLPPISIGDSTTQNENGGVAMIMTSPEGDVVYANKLAKSLYEKHDLGAPQSPLKIDISNKHTLENILDNLDVGNVKFVITEIGRTGSFLKLEVEKIHNNGIFYLWRIFEDIGADDVMNSEQAGPDYYLGFGRTLDDSDIGFFAINENDEVTYANQTFSRFLFADKKEPKLPIDLSVISHHTRSNLKNKVQFVVGKNKLNEAYVKKWQGVNDDDLTFYVVIGNGKVDAKSAGTVGLTNITENSFFGKSPIGIAVISKTGDILERNIVFSNFIAGLELDEISNLSNILSKDNASDVLKEIEKSIKTGQPSSIIELSFLGDSGKQGQFYITSDGNASKDDKEVIIYLIDITEQKNLELQFSQSQKMQAVGQLAGGIAHDFNNLLTAITGFSDLLLVKHGPGDQSFSDIIQIKQNANRAANLVRQLLAFSRQQTLRPKILIITDVVAELSNLLRRLIGSNIELDMNHGRNIDPVKVDQGQLEQVIINLCVNARDAMPEGGKLEIKTRNLSEEDSVKVSKRYKIFPKGEYVLLEVKDNGTGIRYEHLEKVFEPFFSTKEVGKGTGLGLSTVYGIIKQTDGFVFPESEIGVGTTFKIYLPKYSEGEVEAVEGISDIINPEEQVRDLTGSSTILLVEDEDAVRMFASRALKNKGYTVFEADCGVSALKVIDETEVKIDLIISDVMMPQMDGPTLVKKVKETDNDVKVIFISGYAEDALDDNIADKDFNFLSKPFSLKELAEQVKEVLEN